MAIVGVTISETGESITRLAVSTKVAIGERVRRGDKTFPAKLDHFVFLRKSNSLEWETDPILQTHFGHACREIPTVLLDNLIENVFRTEFAWWSKTRRVCHGDGREAIRRTEANPDGEPWRPCGKGCAELERRECKPSGDLVFILEAFPTLGAVAKIHTTSYRSIARISSSLEQISSISGGRLAGLRVKLVMRPEKSSFTDDAGVKKSSTVFVLNIEVGGRETNQLLSRTRLALSEGHAIEQAEHVADLVPANEVASSRSAEPDEKSASVSKAEESYDKTVAANAKITTEQRKKLVEIANHVGWSPDQVKEILREEFGVSNSAEITLDQFDSACSRLGHYQAIESDIPF